MPKKSSYDRELLIHYLTETTNTTKEISDIVGCNINAVRYAKRKLGLTENKRTRHIDMVRFRQMVLACCYTPEEISKETGASVGYVRENKDEEMNYCYSLMCKMIKEGKTFKEVCDALGI